MPSIEQPSAHDGTARRVAWLGPTAPKELAWARRTAAEVAPIDDGAEVPGAFHTTGPAPLVVVLASDSPARWGLDHAVLVARRWPLAVIVSVATSLAEGRRRSGPGLPGIEEIPWCEFPARLAWWLAVLRTGAAGVLGVPAAARREDRCLEIARHTRALARPTLRRVSVAATRPVDLEGTTDLLEASGLTVERRTCGLPSIDDTASLLVWDVGNLGRRELDWLRLLRANRPDMAVVILDSFPRGETALEAMQAGAVAVLGRPFSLESLAGVLVATEPGP
jgi:CheY-like chemotaxis protein